MRAVPLSNGCSGRAVSEYESRVAHCLQEEKLLRDQRALSCRSWQGAAHVGAGSTYAWRQAVARSCPRRQVIHGAFMISFLWALEVFWQLVVRQMESQLC